MARLPFDPDKTRAAQQAKADRTAEHEDAAAAGVERDASRQGGDGVEQGGEPTRQPPHNAGPAPLTVSQAADRLKTALADHFPQKIRVVGEVSNLSDRAHWFFSLKDENATLRCVCFAPNARKVAFQPADGMQVVATGRMDFYDAQGHVQLYVDKLEPVGQGALELQLRQLIDDLRQQGYFDEARKKALPGVPRCVAVVTSRSGAALQDVIHTARRRWPGSRLLRYDVRVQGEAAAPEIAHAIRQLSAHGRRLAIDGVILTRGGGSIEDLWAFNERAVADALVECSIPTVAAIGHETDTTVAELVADRRCATPTQAAMTLIPDRQTLEHQVNQAAERLGTVTRRRVDRARHRLHLAARHALFRQPSQWVEQARRRVEQQQKRVNQVLPRRLTPGRTQLAQCERRLARALPRRLEPARQQLRDVETRFRRLPKRRLQPAKQQLHRLTSRLDAAMPRRLQGDRRRLEAAVKHLAAVNPDNVLQRGYSYTLDEAGGLIQSATRVTPGQRLTTVLHDGRVHSRVDEPHERSSEEQRQTHDKSSDGTAPGQRKPERQKTTDQAKRRKRTIRRNAPTQSDLFEGESG